MKITTELNSKLISCVNKKYESELEENRKEMDTLAKGVTDNYIEMVKKVIAEYPDMINFISTAYGSNNGIECTVRNIVQNRLLFKDSKYMEISNKQRAINDAKKEEIENIKIKISYGKTFEDISNVFEEYGFKF